MRYLVNIVLLFAFVISFSSCGYKPSSKYARKVVGEKVSTSVIISSNNPENTVLLKDAIDSAIIEVFQSSLTSKKYSTTHLNIKLKNVIYDPLAFDKDGYVIAYRAKILLHIDRRTAQHYQSYFQQGTYDFSVVANAVITDSERYNAIKYSAKKAVNSFVSKITSQGIR